MKKNVIIILFLAVFIIFLASGCGNNSKDVIASIESTMNWISNSEYIVTPDTELSKPSFNNMNLTPGIVLSQYNYDNSQGKGFFNGTSSTLAQCEMLDLLLEACKVQNDFDYLYKAGLIGDELTGRVFKATTSDGNAYFISNGKRFDDESKTWVQTSKLVYTKDQFKAAYVLLKLYKATKNSKYLNFGNMLLKSQIALASSIDGTSMKGALPYGYEIVNSKDNIYIPIKTYPLALSKTVYEALSLAEDETSNKSYTQFKSQNASWFMKSINKASDNTITKAFKGGFQEKGDRLVTVNRDGDFWKENFQISTQDLMETFIALIYINPSKALEYQSTVEEICPPRPLTKELMFEKLDTDDDRFFIFHSHNITDMLPTILRLEFLIDTKSSRDKIDSALSAISSMVEQENPSDFNTLGGIRRYQDGPIDLETTAYFIKLMLKHPEYGK